MLYSFAVWVSGFVLGRSPVAVRFPALVCALLSLAMTYRLGRRLLGTEAGLLAAALLATNLTFADYSVNARGYTLSILLTLALVELLFVGAERRGTLVLVLVTSAALVVTLPSMLVLLAGVGVYRVWKYLRLRTVGDLLLILALACGALLGGLFYVSALSSGVGQLSRFGLDNLPQLAAEWLSLVFPPPLGIGIGLVCIAGLAYRMASPKRAWLRSALWFTLVPALLLALAQWLVTGKVFFGRNYLYLMPLVFLAGGSLMFALPFLARRRWVNVALAGALMLSAVFPFRVLGAPTEVDAALARIAQNMSGHDLIVMGCCVDEPVIYHLISAGQTEWVTPSPETRRIFVLVTEFISFDDLLSRFGMTSHVSDCHRADAWEPFEVYECAFHY
jgi:4-amino-4-deoxy-L-arabinose transferase-like glycosyltransferase